MDRLDAETDSGRGVALDRRLFGAKHAILTFVLVLVAQMVAGIAVVMYAVVRDMLRNVHVTGAAYAERMTKEMMPATLYATIIVTLAAVYLVLRWWGGHLVFDRSEHGFGLFAPPPKALVLWTVVGLTSAATILVLSQFVDSEGFKGGPLWQMAESGGSGRFAWAVAGLLYAPVFEELIFRGVMLRGFRASWGLPAASILVTVLFFILHIPEMVGYWPSILGIFLLSVLTLAARLRTGSVVSAMYVHLAYNLMLVSAVYALR